MRSETVKIPQNFLTPKHLRDEVAVKQVRELGKYLFQNHYLLYVLYSVVAVWEKLFVMLTFARKRRPEIVRKLSSNLFPLFTFNKITPSLTWKPKISTLLNSFNIFPSVVAQI